MGSVVRQTVLDAPVDQVWEYFEHPASWSEWDPDIVAVYEEADPGIADGKSWDIAMKAPKQGRLEFSQVVPGKGFTWQVVALGGAIRGIGNFGFSSAAQKDHTDFTYEFQMKGLLGRGLWLLGRKAVVKGVDDGLSNLVNEFSQE